MAEKPATAKKPKAAKGEDLDLAMRVIETKLSGGVHQEMFEEASKMITNHLKKANGG